MEQKYSCIDCMLGGCDTNGKRPQFCVCDQIGDKLKHEIETEYEGENSWMMLCSAEIETEGYMKWPRVREVIEFSKRMNYNKIGIATCVGLLRESNILAKILRDNGLEVFGIGCKIGMVPKTEIGIPEDCCKYGSNSCNPIMQAKLLNEIGTDLNIIMGLCIGHDCLFNKYSKAPTTTLVVKDRALAHNPVGALYTYNSDYNLISRD